MSYRDRKRYAILADALTTYGVFTRFSNRPRTTAGCQLVPVAQRTMHPPIRGMMVRACGIALTITLLALPAFAETPTLLLFREVSPPQLWIYDAHG